MWLSLERRGRVCENPGKEERVIGLIGDKAQNLQMIKGDILNEE
jgi:hypothetical protein